MEVQVKELTTDALMQEVLKNRNKNTARVLKCCAEIEKQAKESGDSRGLGFSYYYEGETYYVLNETEKMFRKMAEAISYLEESMQWEMIARAYNLMAIVSISKGNVSVAMDDYLMGIEYCKKHGLTKIESSINLNLGNLYMENGIYHEAQTYFEKAYAYYESTPEKKRNAATLCMIYTNLAMCYMLRGVLEKTETYIEKLQKECEPFFENLDYIYVDCMKARYYHVIQDTEKTNGCIEDIRIRMRKDENYMDLFEDLYDFCELMLEIGRKDVFLEIEESLERVAEDSGIANLQRKVLSQKMRYLRENGRKDEYQSAAVRFFELMENIEQESQSMISNMLYVRNSLERANESRRKMEADNQRLVEKSETDPMTGLANRARLSDYSEKMMEYCREQKIPLAIEIIDIDYFKQYNDCYGHQAGDECIIAIAEQLKRMQSHRIFCARYGGDEFILIYIGYDGKKVLEKAKELRREIMEMNLKHEQSPAAPIVTISQGICCNIPKQGNKSWDFLHQADMMLYRVKKEKRNDIHISDLYGQTLDHALGIE